MVTGGGSRAAAVFKTERLDVAAVLDPALIKITLMQISKSRYTFALI